MKLNILLSISLTVIIGISLIPLIGSLSEDAQSDQVEVVELSTDLDYDKLPIQIKAGDTFVHTKPEFREGIIYTIYMQNGTVTSNRWGFSFTGNMQAVWYNNTSFIFTSGEWNLPVLSAPYSDDWITWTVDGDVGTLTFLQDFPVVLDTMITSTSQLRDSWNIVTTYDTTDVLNYTQEIEVITITDRLVNLIPVISVLILIGAVVVYVKLKH